MNTFYDKNGKIIPIELWSQLMDDPDYRKVDKTDLPNDVWVSTVWLGIDHGSGHRSILFETMVFGGEMDTECERYETLEQAQREHDRMVERVRTIEGLT